MISPNSSEGPDRVRVLVTLRADLAGTEEELIRELDEAGLSVEEVSSVLGIVTGTVERTAMERLEALPSIEAVEPEGEVTI
jgi:DNA-directed RNA polymerase specialized sigma24 family protein